MDKNTETPITVRFFQAVLFSLFTVLLVLPLAVSAHNNVVVIPMAGDDIFPDPFALVAADSPADDNYEAGHFNSLIFGVDPQTTLDKTTGLLWQRQDDDIQRNWDDAWNYCQDLVITYPVLFGGTAELRGWRLPGINELQSIVDYSASHPAINQGAFPGTNTARAYTTAITQSDKNPAFDSDSSEFVWGVLFFRGEVGATAKADGRYVRCVRSMRPSGPVLQEKNNGTVLDLATGLIWQRIGDNMRKTWNDAISYCNSLSLAGNTNWRLPDIKELTSIVDYRVNRPAIDNEKFPETISSFYWSASRNMFNGAESRVVRFRRGTVNFADRSSEQFVRCVR